MKKIIFIISILSVIFCKAQLSGGYVLDGTYKVGHFPFCNYADTLNQTYATANVAKAIKIRKSEDTSTINIIQDTMIKVCYPGYYLIRYCLNVYNNDNSWEREMSTWIGRQSGQGYPNTHYVSLLDPIRTRLVQNENILKLQPTDTIKIMWSQDNTSLELKTVGAAANPSRPQIPAVRLIIYKISDL
ncbi:MAG: hypothetical protein HOP11_09555 [Saprospiraceae bacterium]|nr:hypothetical protein [Saprospiraceae bacterium]